MQVGARLRVDLQMPVGQVTEKVEVTAASPLLETDSSQRGQVITGDQTRALPLLSREYSSLALLTTGVKLAGSSLTTGNTPREGAFNVNGLRSTFNNFLIDGVDNNAYGTSNQGFSNQVMQPPPDAIGEFKVVTNNMSAEYGRAAGATINVNYRSGTNTLHGERVGVPARHALNATGFFKPADRQAGELDRNQFGGVLGGPIVKNKAFFFADYEGLRQTRKVTAICDASPRRRSGRASSSVDVRDPRTGVVYPAGTPIPMTGFRAQGARRRCPTRTCPATRTTTATLQEFTADSDKAGGKIDLQVTPGAVDVRPLRLPQPDDLRSAEHPAAVRRRRQRRHLRAQPAAGPRRRPGCRARRRCSKCGSASRGREAGKNPPALGTDSALDAVRPAGLPTTAASPAACRRSSSPATRISAGRRPIRSGSTRRSTTRR